MTEFDRPRHRRWHFLIAIVGVAEQMNGAAKGGGIAVASRCDSGNTGWQSFSSGGVAESAKCRRDAERLTRA